jgi:membrane-bound ClpP family serine protease
MLPFGSSRKTGYSPKGKEDIGCRMWSRRVVVKYVLLQIPGLVALILVLVLVQRWVSLPAWLSWVAVFGWIAKDAFLFPFVWRAYDSDAKEGASSMVGGTGIANDRLAPTGYVQIRGELWKAKMVGSGPPIEIGEEVRVRGARGLTLLVEPGNTTTTGAEE